MTFSALAGVCQTCHGSVIPSSRATDGALTEWCGTCRVESVTTVRGRHFHDQRARLDAELAKDLKRDTAPANPAYQHTRYWRPLDV